MITITQKSGKTIKDAEKVLKAISGVASEIDGVAWHGTERRGESLSNGQVFSYLEKRGVQLIGDEAAMEAAKAFAAEVTERLAARSKKMSGKALSTTVSIHAWRAAAAAVARHISERIERQMTGYTVDEHYAEWRSAKYGVPNDTSLVGIASGQLLADLAPTRASKLAKLIKKS